MQASSFWRSFFKSPKKGGGGSHQGSVPALSPTKVVGKKKRGFSPRMLRYGTLKLKGLECEILSYVEWMDRLGDGGGPETNSFAPENGWFGIGSFPFWVSAHIFREQKLVSGRLETRRPSLPTHLHGDQFPTASGWKNPGKMGSFFPWDIWSWYWLWLKTMTEKGFQSHSFFSGCTWKTAIAVNFHQLETTKTNHSYPSKKRGAMLVSGRVSEAFVSSYIENQIGLMVFLTENLPPRRRTTGTEN